MKPHFNTYCHDIERRSIQRSNVVVHNVVMEKRLDEMRIRFAGESSSGRGVELEDWRRCSAL
jgi:hypothetical protein